MDMNKILTAVAEGGMSVDEFVARTYKNTNFNNILENDYCKEAFGRIAAEGESMGRIVIASNIGGSLENLVDGKTGKHFESGNADSLAEALTWALDLSTEDREKIGKAAIEHVHENFTKEIMCNKTIAVYNELVNM